MAKKQDTAPRLTLAEISAQFGALEAILDSLEGETTPETEAWMQEYNLAERDKVDGYITYMKHLDGLEAAAKATAAEFTAKAKTFANRRDWLKRRVEFYMQERGLEELQGSIFRFQYEGNGGKEPLIFQTTNPEDFPPELVDITVTINNDRVRELLAASWEKAGVLEGKVCLGQRGRHLAIR